MPPVPLAKTPFPQPFDLPSWRRNYHSDHNMNELPTFDWRFPFPASKAPQIHQSHALGATHHSPTPSHPLSNQGGSAPPPSHTLDDHCTVTVRSSPAHGYGRLQPFASPTGSVHGTSAYLGRGAGGNLHSPSRMASCPYPSLHLKYRQPLWPSSSLPATTDTVNNKAHNPNSCLSSVSTQQSELKYGYVVSTQHRCPKRDHCGPGLANDRPFKCDQCPQSFNRNHDLKRHKRIHLSIKPYPCTYCDKRFSRKDALRRHTFSKTCAENVNASKQERDLKETDKA